MSSKRIQTYEEFWIFYLNEHRNPTNRKLHLFGTTLAVATVVPVAMWDYHFLVISLVCGYAFAWIGHFVFEKNRPATFRYPFWSLISDFNMLFSFVNGTLDAELNRALENRQS